MTSTAASWRPEQVYVDEQRARSDDLEELARGAFGAAKLPCVASCNGSLMTAPEHSDY